MICKGNAMGGRGGEFEVNNGNYNQHGKDNRSNNYKDKTKQKL